jgi:hypothetical protein
VTCKQQVTTYLPPFYPPSTSHPTPEKKSNATGAILDGCLTTRICLIKFLNLAKKIASSEECCLLLENALNSIGPQLEDKINASFSATNEPSNEQENVDQNVDPNVQPTAEFLNAAQLKKKEV